MSRKLDRNKNLSYKGDKPSNDYNLTMDIQTRLGNFSNEKGNKIPKEE